MKINWKQDKTNIKQLLLSGKTLEQIALKFNVTKQAISNGIKKHIPELQKSNVVKLRKQKRIAEIQKLYNRNTFSYLTDIERAQGLFFTRKRQNNKYRKWEWSITMSDLTWPKYCPVLGLELDWFADKRQENSPSIDRIDSTKGYIPGNVQIVSWRANRIKNDGTAREHQLIFEYLTKKNKSVTL